MLLLKIHLRGRVVGCVDCLYFPLFKTFNKYCLLNHVFAPVSLYLTWMFRNVVEEPGNKLIF